ncbi:MAG: NUDIX domain-containing protein [Lachnospiraceae bacterium]|nr:NUDIX domain-containing protein [Lachnospiraceae bacterium]
MEQKQELLDILDCNGNPTGKVHIRGTDRAPGEYIGVVVVCVIHSDGRMLIQQRASEKGWGNKWDVSCSGAISHGETPQIAAMRELKEELGLDADLTNVRPSLVTLFSNGFSYAFVIKMDTDPASITLQEEEVQDVCLASKDTILEMIREESFVPYRTSWIEYVFDFAEQNYLF